MTKNKLAFAEGASINRPPMFYDLKYQFCKVRMRIFIESIDRGVWDVTVNRPFVPQAIVDNQYVDKPWFDWIDSESKKAL